MHTQAGEGQREREREGIASRLHAANTEPDMVPEPTNCKTVT